MPDQSTDNDNSGKNDPNMTGSGQAKAVAVPVAGKMTPTREYDEKTPFYGRK